MIKKQNQIKRNSPSDVKRVLAMQRLFTVTAAVAVLMGAAIVITLGARLIAKAGRFAISANSQNTVVPIISTEPETTTSIVYQTEKLADDELSDNYWGPLDELPEDSIKTHTHNEIHGIYIGSCSALDSAIELCNNSELNAVVIDIKNEWGIPFNCSNETARQIGYVWDAYDIDEVIAKCHENNILVIGRIVSFNDCTAAEHFPERSIRDKDGNTLFFSNESSHPFLSPYNKDNWDYLISIAEEAASHGLDEIQFDYVRFPAGSTTTGSSPYYGEDSTTPSKSAAINRFLQEARIRIQDKLGVPVSADIFGIVLTSGLDAANIGQDFTTLGMTGIDSCCPMTYPSHYALGTKIGGHTFDYPDKEPYMLVYSVLQACKNTFSQTGFTNVRPYLQAFTASYIGAGNYMDYGYAQINTQIKALHDLGMNEYILWDPNCRYPAGSYDGDMSVSDD